MANFGGKKPSIEGEWEPCSKYLSMAIKSHCASVWLDMIKIKIKIKIKKLCLTSRFETDNISSVELLLRHNE